MESTTVLAFFGGWRAKFKWRRVYRCSHEVLGNLQRAIGYARVIGAHIGAF